MAAEPSAAPRASGPIERARQSEARKLARRSFLRVSVFAGLALSFGAMTAGFLGFFNLRKPSGFGGLVNVAASRIPHPGAEPTRNREGKFWLVNL
ncbi:MAG: hypothetical protein FIB00_16375, partial [Chloroflexi bacterium]|nr:hypothetical protein [Chloroflexota bacterium]